MDRKKRITDYKAKYYKDGTIESETWIQDEQDITVYYKNNMIYKIIYCREGRFHRENRPAVLEIKGKTYTLEWYKNGGRYRSDGPSYERYYKNISLEAVFDENDLLYNKTKPYYITFHINGRLRQMRWNEHVHGLSSVEFYMNGNIKQIWFDDDSYTYYHPDGKIRREYIIYNGKSLFIMYDKNGVISAYKNNKRVDFDKFGEII